VAKYTTEVIEKLSELGFRDTFGREILEIGEMYPNTVVLAADLSDATRVTKFSEKFPNNFIQVGIAEQNMMSIASGLSLNGKMCFCATFASFATLRCCEQVRNDICYQNRNVKIIGIDSGVATGYLGVTHYGLEDIAVMRGISNLTVISPSDCLSLAKLLWEIVKYEGPVYIRLSGGKNIPIIYHEDYEFKIGESVALTEGKDVSIFATGLMVSEALEAASILRKRGIEVKVIDIHTIKPLDIKAIKKAAEETKLIVTVEEHNLTGGLGSAVAEVIAEQGVSSKLVRIGLPDKFISKFGSHKALLKRYGLTCSNIADKAINNL